MIRHQNSVPSMPDKVILLGHTGFVGCRLERSLKTQGVSPVGFSSSQLDLTRKDQLETLAAQLTPETVLVVLAAITPDRGKDRAAMIKNIVMADNLAALLEGKTLRQLVLVSSDAVYGTVQGLISEQTPCDPDSLYGVGHLTREKILRDIAQRSAIPYLVLRPCAMFGRGDPHNSYGPNRFVKTALQQGKIEVFGSGADKRDHLYVDDFVALIVSAIRNCSVGLVNVATGHSLTFQEVADRVKAHCPDSIVKYLENNSRPSALHFDVTQITKAFPECRMTSLEQGLAAIFSASSQQ